MAEATKSPGGAELCRVRRLLMETKAAVVRNRAVPGQNPARDVLPQGRIAPRAGLTPFNTPFFFSQSTGRCGWPQDPKQGCDPEGADTTHLSPTNKHTPTPESYPTSVFSGSLQNLFLPKFLTKFVDLIETFEVQYRSPTKCDRYVPLAFSTTGFPCSKGYP